jgi:hypothetical protein
MFPEETKLVPVIAPALKLPEASLATSVEAVLAVSLWRSDAAAVRNTNALPDRLSREPVELLSRERASKVPVAV